MKKLVAIILAGLMLLSLVACGAKDDVVKFGVLEIESSGANKAHDSAHSELESPEYTYYKNLSTALMDLNSGKITVLCLEEASAAYVVARNDKLAIADTGDEAFNVDFSMMTMENNKEVYDILNNAIKEMKADGTLATLIENELKAYINSDPETKELPKFDGAKTIKVGVTGDVPPMDFVASNGKAAGFNIALLAEIANRAQVNIELVQVDTDARAMALSSGNVDAVFWTKSVTCSKCNESWGESIDDTLVTESYFTDKSAFVVLKSDK